MSGRLVWRPWQDGAWPACRAEIPGGGQLVASMMPGHVWRWGVFPAHGQPAVAAAGDAGDKRQAKRAAVLAAVKLGVLP